LIAYIYNYLKGFIEGYCQVVSSENMEEFFKNIDSNLILYGYQDGNFFEEDYEDEEEYQEALSKLRERSSSR